MFDLGPPPKLWTPARPAIIRAGEILKPLPKHKWAMPGFFGALAAVDSGLQVVSHQENCTSADSTTYNLAVALTGAWDGLLIGVCNRSSATRTISSLAVSGNGWTQATSVTSSARHSAVGAIKLVGSGSITVDVTFSGACNGAGVQVLAVSGLQSATSFASATDTADPLDFLIDVEANGIILATTIGAETSYAGACDWTGATEFRDSNTPDGSTSFSMSSAYYLAGNSAETNRAVSADWSPTPSAAAGVAAAFK